MSGYDCTNYCPAQSCNRACHLFCTGKESHFLDNGMVVQDNYNHRENSRIIIIIGRIPTVIITLPNSYADGIIAGLKSLPYQRSICLPHEQIYGYCQAV